MLELRKWMRIKEVSKRWRGCMGVDIKLVNWVAMIVTMFCN